MKAALIYSYGSADVLEVRSEIKIPEPQESEVLIRVKAASINPIDWKIRKGMVKFISGFKFPKILGFDVAGEIAGIGSQVRHFRVGDPVFGMLRSFTQGSYAEFTVAPENILLHKPKNLSFEEAASLPLAGLTAIQALDMAAIDSGKRVLVLGGSGGVGSLAIQIAKAYGCEVAASAGPQNQMLLRELGADHTFDYGSQTIQDLDGNFDIILDAVGKETFSHCRPLLSKKGVYITTVPGFSNVWNLVLSPLRSQKTKFIIAKSNHKDLQLLKKMFEKDKLSPVVDRVYTLDQIREAHLYAETGHARGKVVIKVSD